MIDHIVFDSKGIGAVVGAFGLLQELTKKAETGVFSIILHDAERLFENQPGITVQDRMVFTADIMLPCHGRPVVVPVIGNAGSSAVTDHLRQIAHRHLVAIDKPSGLVGVVDPVLKVVLVSALVVQPGFGAAVIDQTLDSIGRTVTVIIADTGPELKRRELGKVMKDALTIKAKPETSLRHILFMCADCQEVTAQTVPECSCLKSIAVHSERIIP